MPITMPRDADQARRDVFELDELDPLVTRIRRQPRDDGCAEAGHPDVNVDIVD